MLYTVCTIEVKRRERTPWTEVARECLMEEAPQHDLELHFRRQKVGFFKTEERRGKIR